MTHFTDHLNHRWQIRVNVGTVRRLADEGFDLLALAENKFAGYGAIVEDPVAFTSMLWLLCKPDAEPEGITEDYFGDFTGEAMGAAIMAFCREFNRFWPQKDDSLAPSKEAEEDDEDAEPLTAVGLERTILRFAGWLGLDPDRYTFRELFIMAEGRRSETWNHTASTMTLTANCNRDPNKGKPFRYDQFHPYAKKRRGSKGDTAGLTAMAAAAKARRFN